MIDKVIGVLLQDELMIIRTLLEHREIMNLRISRKVENVKEPNNFTNNGIIKRKERETNI